MDSRGRVFVSDTGRGNVFVYDGSGTASATLADPSSGGIGGAPRFQDVRSIVVSSGLSTYVLDAGPGRVYGYDLSNQLRGTHLDVESSMVESRFGPVRAAAFLIDRTGQPIVADREGDRLLVFSADWEPRHVIGGPGINSGGFRDPVALALDDQGRIIVADRGNRLVQVLSQSGTFLTEYALDHAPESVAATPDGDIFVGDAAGFIVILPHGGGRSQVPPPTGGVGPVMLALSADGKALYVSRPVLGTVEVMDVVQGESP